jgi:hypothetical protein
VNIFTPQPAQSWKFDFNKSSGAFPYETSIGTMIIHQDRTTIPSQTLQIPFVIANVRDGTAELQPLEFATTIRETYSGGNADIVATDRFSWDVTGPLTVGGADSDWLFVPIKSTNIDSNVVNYQLITNVKNYSGIRYALQRYDRLGTTLKMQPKRWMMDIPSKNSRVSNRVVSLDLLSHIAPGLTTTYEEQFNVISEGNRIYQIYPVDPAKIFHDLNLWHPSVFGLDLGMAKGADYTVNAFGLIASDPDFLSKASAAIGVKNAIMPDASNSGILGSAVSFANVGAEAINSFTRSTDVPANLLRSNDVTGLLPLHVTINIPSTNRLIIPVWDKLWDEWSLNGDIKDLFADSFRIYVRDSAARNVDLIGWLQERGLYSRLVKVFMDDDQSRITVSFIAMLVDSNVSEISTVHDSSVTSDNEYVVLKDGREDDSWGVTIFTAPKGYVSADNGGNSGGSGGGGGCASGLIWPFAIVFLPLIASRVFKIERFH